MAGTPVRAVEGALVCWETLGGIGVVEVGVVEVVVGKGVWCENS